MKIFAKLIIWDNHIVLSYLLVEQRGIYEITNTTFCTRINTTGEISNPGPSQLIHISWGKGVRVDVVEIPHKLNSPLKYSVCEEMYRIKKIIIIK